MAICISVITVCYNAVNHIEKTIQSVMSQTYENIEYIVIDGGSTDGTLRIIEKYAERLSYYVSEPDNGIYDAMNKGLKHVTGEWVNFMNAGDTFHDDYVIDAIFGPSSVLKNNLDTLRIIGGNTNNVCKVDSWIHKAENPSVIPYRIPFSHQACFIRPPFEFDLKYPISADYKVMYDFYYKYGESSIVSLDLIMENYIDAKKEYLRIQSEHPSFQWLKDYIRYILFKR